MDRTRWHAGSSEGDFLTSAYGTGNILDGDWCWRGFGFEAAEDTAVSALIGGGVTGTPDAAFLGAIWEDSYDAETGTLTGGDVIAQVTFPEGENLAVPLASPVTLGAGITKAIRPVARPSARPVTASRTAVEDEGQEPDDSGHTRSDAPSAPLAFHPAQRCANLCRPTTPRRPPESEGDHHG